MPQPVWQFWRLMAALGGGTGCSARRFRVECASRQDLRPALSGPCQVQAQFLCSVSRSARVLDDGTVDTSFPISIFPTWLLFPSLPGLLSFSCITRLLAPAKRLLRSFPRRQLCPSPSPRRDVRQTRRHCRSPAPPSHALKTHRPFSTTQAKIRLSSLNR